MSKLTSSRPGGTLRARLERVKGATLYPQATPTGPGAGAEDSVAVRLRRLRVGSPPARRLSTQTVMDESPASARARLDAKARVESRPRFTSQAGANADAALAALAGGECVAPGLIEVTRRLSHGTRHGVETLASPTSTKTLTGAAAPVYFDTETTGLAGGTGTAVFMLGFAFHDEAAPGAAGEQVPSSSSGAAGERCQFSPGERVPGSSRRARGQTTDVERLSWRSRVVRASRLITAAR